MIFKTRVLRTHLYNQGVELFGGLGVAAPGGFLKPRPPAPLERTQPSQKPKHLVAPSKRLQKASLGFLEKKAQKQAALSQQASQQSSLQRSATVGDLPIRPFSTLGFRPRSPKREVAKLVRAVSAGRRSRLEDEGGEAISVVGSGVVGSQRRRPLYDFFSVEDVEGDPSFIDFSDEPEDRRCVLPAHRIGDTLPENLHNAVLAASRTAGNQPIVSSATVRETATTAARIGAAGAHRGARSDAIRTGAASVAPGLAISARSFPLKSRYYPASSGERGPLACGSPLDYSGINMSEWRKAMTMGAEAEDVICSDDDPLSPD
jgi:hypothetical protein